MTSPTKAAMRRLKDRMADGSATSEEWEKFGEMADRHPRIAQSIVDDYYRAIGEEPHRRPEFARMNGPGRSGKNTQERSRNV